MVTPFKISKLVIWSVVHTLIEVLVLVLHLPFIMTVPQTSFLL